MLTSWWVVIAAALAGAAVGAALVHAVHLSGSRPTDRRHALGTGYSVMETAARIKERDRNPLWLAAPLPQFDDLPTEPIPVAQPAAFPWPVTLTYRRLP